MRARMSVETSLESPVRRRPESTDRCPALSTDAESHRRTSALRWFVPTPVAMLLDPSLSSDGKVLAGILLHYNGPHGCHPKVATLMRDMNASKNKVLRLLEELERYGFLTRDRRGRNNTYCLRPVYERPIRADSFEATGQLQALDAPRPRPAKRNTLHKPCAAPSERAKQTTVPPVEPIGTALRRSRTQGSVQRVPPVEPISARAEGRDITSSTKVDPEPPERVSPVQPSSVPNMEPNDKNRSHRWNLENSNNHETRKNQQQQDTTAVFTTATDEDTRTTIGGAEDDPTPDAAIAALQRVRVNLTKRELGVHAGRGRTLVPRELLAWARWVGATPARGIANKPGFAASKIRMGCTLDDVFPGATAASYSGNDALQSLAPELRNMLFEAIRNGTRFDARWLSERDIPPQAMARARECVAADAAAEVSETPFCDALRASNPVEYRACLQRILDGLESPKILNAQRTLDHPMFLGMCRARLERELALERGSS
jgi:hypothetical protein